MDSSGEVARISDAGIAGGLIDTPREGHDDHPASVQAATHGAPAGGAILLAEQVLYWCAECGLGGVSVVSALHEEASAARGREGRQAAGAVSLTLSAGWTAQERLVQVAGRLAEWLGDAADVSPTVDRGARLQVLASRLLKVLPPLVSAEALERICAKPACLIPVGSTRTAAAGSTPTGARPGTRSSPAIGQRH